MGIKYLDSRGQPFISTTLIKYIFADDSRNSHRLRSEEQQHTQNMLPQIQEEYGYYQEQRNRYPKQTAFDSTDMDWQRIGNGVQQNGNFLLHSTPAAVSAVPNRNSGRENKERISVPPLNTLRLQPTRYKTKNAIMSILANGEVVIEFIKSKGKMNEDRIIDVCRISSDGRRIIIYQPDPGR